MRLFVTLVLAVTLLCFAGNALELSASDGVVSTNNNKKGKKITPYGHNGPANGTVQLAAFYGLLGRVFKETDMNTLQNWIKVDLQVSPLKNHSSQGWYQYSVDSRDGSLHISGSSANSAGAGVHHFMRHYLNSSVTWGDKESGWNVRPLSYWIARGGFPSLSSKSQQKKTTNTMEAKSLGAYRYYMNVCTLGYTMGFWGWDEWEKHIDWMTLHGINLPLASVGSEYIWLQTWLDSKFNLTTAEVLDYFTGPAFFPWLRMGNIHTWAGPVSVKYLENRRDLQRRLLARMSEMGMSPILPAFDGHVPNSLKNKFPNANIIQGPNWLGNGVTGASEGKYSQNMLMDPTDPLFPQIAEVFMTKLTEIYGTSDFYNADTYNEMVPSSGSHTYLHDSSKAVYDGLSEFNPNATWVMQGWLFVVDQAFWTSSAIQAYLGGVPKDGLLILDLTSDYKPQFERTQGYYGYHWIWCMLHNYGGRRGIYGNMTDIATRPFLDYTSYPSMTGTGMTMEAIDQNQIIYELLLEMSWRADITSSDEKKKQTDAALDSNALRLSESGPMSTNQLNDWIATYIFARYNSTLFTGTPSAEGLAASLFQPLIQNDGPMSHMVRCCYHFTTMIDRPWIGNVNTWVDYNPDTIYRSWFSIFEFYKKHPAQFEAMMNSADGFSTFRYDVIDFTRQFISNVFTDAQQMIQYMTYSVHSPTVPLTSLKKFLADEIVLQMMEVLMGSDENFLLGNWMDRAIKQAAPGDKADLENLEFNAKAQVTIWGPGGTVYDYAGKPWNGLLKHYHYPRWVYLFDQVIASWPNPINQQQLDYNLLQKIDTPFARNTSFETGAGQFSTTPTLGKGVIPIFEKLSEWMTLADQVKANATVHQNVAILTTGQTFLPTGSWHSSTNTPVPALMCAKLAPSCWAWDSNGVLYGDKPKGTIGKEGSGSVTVWVVKS